MAEELPADAHLHKITNYSFETHFLAILQILISWLLNSLEAHMATFHTFLRYEMIIDFDCFVTLLSLFSRDVRRISMVSTLEALGRLDAWSSDMDTNIMLTASDLNSVCLTILVWRDCSGQSLLVLWSDIIMSII